MSPKQPLLREVAEREKQLFSQFFKNLSVIIQLILHKMLLIPDTYRYIECTVIHCTTVGSKALLERPYNCLFVCLYTIRISVLVSAPLSFCNSAQADQEQHFPLLYSARVQYATPCNKETMSRDLSPLILLITNQHTFSGHYTVSPYPVSGYGKDRTDIQDKR